MNYNGKKVKIDTEKFNNRRLSKRFATFLDDAKEKTFTARLDVSRAGLTMYTLDEDTNDPKWLWYESDLKIVEEN